MLTTEELIALLDVYPAGIIPDLAAEVIRLRAREAAVRNAALEEAAVIAEHTRDYAGLDQDGEPYLTEDVHLHGCGIANDIAVSIRAMKEATPCPPQT